MSVGSALWPCGVTFRPTASHPSSDICRIRVHGKHNMHAYPVQTPVKLALGHCNRTIDPRSVQG